MMTDGMADMGRIHPEPSQPCCDKPAEPRGPDYPRLHDIDADKLPALKTTPIGSEVTIVIKAKLVGLEMHDTKNGIDSYWPANAADLEILAAKVMSAPTAKTNNMEVAESDLPQKSGKGMSAMLEEEPPEE